MMNLIIKYLRKNIGIQNYSLSIHNFLGGMERLAQVVSGYVATIVFVCQNL